MNRQAEKKQILRYGILALLVLAAWLIENTLSLLFPLNQIELYLVVSVITAIAMLEEELPAALYGLSGGLLMDIFTPGQLGLNSILLLMIGLFTSLCISHFIRSTILTNLIFSAAALLFYVFFYWLFMLVFKGVDNSFTAFLTIFLPRAVITFILSPFIYVLVRRIRKKFVA